jgi:hypothetical protein
MLLVVATDPSPEGPALLTPCAPVSHCLSSSAGTLTPPILVCKDRPRASARPTRAARARAQVRRAERAGGHAVLRLGVPARGGRRHDVQCQPGPVHLRRAGRRHDRRAPGMGLRVRARGAPPGAGGRTRCHACLRQWRCQHAAIPDKQSWLELVCMGAARAQST